jgi:septal ring factor EnvC (AmiA/AmiB activator)
MATDYTQWQPEALAQIIAFREKSMEQFAERIASLEADNARLREALQAMVTATSNFNQGLAAARDMADAALAAHKQARSKGE